MSRRLTQPEEIDLILKEIEKFDRYIDMQAADKKYMDRVAREGWDGGYLAPYRTAHLKTQRLES